MCAVGSRIQSDFLDLAVDSARVLAGSKVRRRAHPAREQEALGTQVSDLHPTDVASHTVIFGQVVCARQQAGGLLVYAEGRFIPVPAQ